MTQGIVLIVIVGFPVVAIVMLRVLQRYCPKPQTTGDARSRRLL